MFSGLSRVLLQIKRLGSLKWTGEFCLNTHSENICRSLSVIKLQKHALTEENTVSKKVIEYMRSNPEYATSFTSTADHKGITSPLNTSETHQLLLKIADSKETKPCEILSLFTQYVSQKQDLLQDVYTKRKILLTVKERIFQTLPQMTFDDLRKLAIILKYLNFKENRYLIDVVTGIDNECVKRASMVDLEQCLKFYDILLSLHGSHLHRKKQFNVFLSLFVMHTAKAKPHHLVQILHYFGAARKNRLDKEYIKVFITKLQETFEQISFIDAGIALEAIFKCNVKLDKSSLLVRKTTKCLQMKGDESERLSDLESYAFVAMIKVIRAARYHDKALLRSVSNFVVKSDANNFNPQVLAHTLALYANSQVYDPAVFTKLECIMLKHISEHSHSIRSKDISRLLWSFSHVGHKLKDNFFETVEKVLAGLLHKGEYDYYPEHLSGSLFSLAVLGHYPKELIEEAFKPQNIEKLQGYKRSKQFSRLLGLYEALKIEAPEISVALPQIYTGVVPKRTLSDEIHHRPALAKLMKGVSYINKSVGSCVLELKFPLPIINYASLIYDPRGMKVENLSENFVSQELTRIRETVGAERVAFEIIDSHLLILGNMELIGILKMKLRLMSKCRWKVCTVFEDDVNKFNCDEKTMAAFILDTLSNMIM